MRSVIAFVAPYGESGASGASSESGACAVVPESGACAAAPGMGERMGFPYTAADEEKTNARTPAPTHASISVSEAATLLRWKASGRRTDSATSIEPAKCSTPSKGPWRSNRAASAAASPTSARTSSAPCTNAARPARRSSTTTAPWPA
jgi:hypothetical protein